MNNNISIFTVTNWERRYFCERFIREIHKTSGMPVFVFENGDYGNNNLYQFLADTDCGDIVLYKSKKRLGLANAWNSCMLLSQTDWTLISNDDSIPKKDWSKKLDGLIDKMSHKMFLICHPNSFSAFCLHKPFWEKHLGFNREFQSGYYEDDDFFLRVGFNEGCTDIKSIFDKFIYSYPREHNDGLFTHLPQLPTQTPTTKWDREANRIVFEKYWKEVPPGTQNALENKNGRWFVPKQR